jgi:DNA (cytosine-5)-methyltransferase 1
MVTAGRQSRRSLTPSAVSFFAGIGGFDLGLERAGFEIQFQCEIAPFCAQVLSRHWPNVRRASDIRSVCAKDIPNVQLWTGGFPCQDLSVARGARGRDGLAGSNSGLFFPFLDLVRARRPQVVLLENVVGLLSANSGADFHVVLRSFVELGYSVAWRVCNTRYFGAPQSRPRVYICCWRGAAESAISSLYQSGQHQLLENPRAAFVRGDRCRKTGAIVPETAFCLAATSGRHTGTDWSRSYIAYPNKVRRITPQEAERIQGFPAGWSDVPVPGGDGDSLRYHAVGNAVSVPVVEWIAKRIIAELGRRDVSGDIKSWLYQYPVCEATDCLFPLAGRPFPKSHDGRRWKRGGLVSGTVVIDAQVTPSPIAPILSRFVDALDPDRPCEKYFISANAATGILRRVKSQGRELFPPLAKSLRKLARTGRATKALAD